MLQNAAAHIVEAALTSDVSATVHMDLSPQEAGLQQCAVAADRELIGANSLQLLLP